MRSKRLRLSVPTINDSLQDYDTLFRLFEMVTQHRGEVSFEFSSCRFLRQNAVAFLGGLARLAQHHSRRVQFEWHTLSPKVLQSLQGNSFYMAMGGTSTAYSSTAVPYREDAEFNKHGLMSYLTTEWLDQQRIDLGRQLRSRIVGKVVEIYDNAFAHSVSPVGVMSCGQHYPYLGQLHLTVVDFGVSIPFNVANFLGNPDLDAAEALKWAFMTGTTTKPTMSRGLGLELLKEFIQVNNGSLDVFSGNGLARVRSTSETYLLRPTSFTGTVVNIGVRCDERSYRLANEVEYGPLF